MTTPPDKRDDGRDDGPEDKSSVEGYWHSLEVERDPDSEAARHQRILDADEARRARQAAAAARGPGRHHERIGRQFRSRGKDAIAVIALVILGLATTLVIISEQKASLPGWVPVFGQDFFHVDAEFQTGQAIMPGQGQAVTISGIRVGKIDSVELDDGHALVGLDIEPKYAQLIHEDASLLLRPKTGLQDMVVEVDPGTSDELMEDGTQISLESTLPNVNPDAVLATLDADTRNYVQLLLQGVALGLDGRGTQLSGIWRRLYPFTRDIARLNTAVAKRREALAQVIHSFGDLSEELAAHDTDIVRFVDGSQASLGHFANQASNLSAALRELPSTLRQTNSALASANSLSEEMRPALTKLAPQADAFAPALRQLQDFFDQTTATVSGQITPFTRQIRPPLGTLASAAKPFRNTVQGFRDTIKPFNYGLNELAYDPPGSVQSHLFYLPWLNHNLSSGYLIPDAGGPIRRGTVLLSCNTASLANGFANGRPFLRSLLQLTRVPSVPEAC